MGCVSSVPSSVHSGDGKSLAAQDPSVDGARPNGDKSGRPGGEMDTTASGKQSDWQMPLIWDLKTGRNPSIQNDNSGSLGLHLSPSIKSASGAREASRLQRSQSEQSVRRSLSRRIGNRSLILPESPDQHGPRAVGSQPSLKPLSRSKSFASSSPAGSGIGTPVMQSPGSDGSSYQASVKHIVVTRKRTLLAPSNVLESRHSLKSRSVSTFIDISKPRFS